MNTFKDCCEMDINGLMKMLVGDQPSQTQPTSNIGSFGKLAGSSSKNITIKPLEDGGITVMSADLNIKLSKEVFDSIKEFIGGTNNEQGC